MDAVLSLDRFLDLPEDERAAIRALTDIVYPPHVWADWPGYQMEWAPHEWCVRVRVGEGGAALVSYVGINLRQATLDGKPVRVGGVGGVKTHPAVRRCGHARLALRQAEKFFYEQGAAFALLVCEPRLLYYYGRLGWQEFGGRLVVTQRGAEADFTFLRVMVCGIEDGAPSSGVIHLAGPPW